VDREPGKSPQSATSLPSLAGRLAQVAFAAGLALIALYFGDQALEVTRLPYSTLAWRDLLNAVLMAMMCVIFACWAMITIRGGRTRSTKEKGGTP
jgi:hypothetical protein